MTLAKDLCPGMKLTCDMGYGHPLVEVCTVVEVLLGTNLFNAPVVRVGVHRHTGKFVRLADFQPDDKVGPQ